MKRTLALFLTLTMLLSLAACSDSGGSPSTDLMRDISANVLADTPSATDTQSALTITDFGVRLVQSAHEGGKNLLLSPLSVLCALAMTANGAKEETLAQMEAVFGLTLDELNDYLRRYVAALPQGEHYRLHLANSIWFTEHSRFTPEPKFLQVNADYYGADIYSAPFDDSTLREINSWVNEKTDGMIDSILDEIPMDAVMYLINALAFEAQWSSIYNEYDVRDGTFTTENGTERSIELMYAFENCYLEDELATGFIKYCKDHAYAFVALLPKEGVTVTDYLRSLSGETLHALLANAQSGIVDTAIPKFEATYSTELSQVLIDMGVVDAFDPSQADLSGLGKSAAGNIHINRVLHKTFISVTEQGTKAAAVTVVEPTDGAFLEPDKMQEVILDRPFIYLLIDCENNIPFFIGVLADTEQ